MWVFLNDAFLSIVAHRDRPGQLLVRARHAGDIEAVFPNAEVTKTPRADYRYRATLPAGDVSEVLAERVMDIDYPNFKNSVQEPDRHIFYADVWSVMRDFQTVDEAET